MRIGLDMDGVLYCWDRAVRRMIYEEFGVDVPTSETWSFIHDFAGKKVWNWLWAHPGNVDKMFATGFAYPGAVEGAKRLYELVDELYILTSGPKGCEEAKVAWLESRGIPFDRFIRFDHGEPKTKMQCDLYVDDNPAVIADVVAARFPSMAVLVDRPWNSGEEAPVASPRWARAHGWEEIVARAEDVLA